MDVTTVTPMKRGLKVNAGAGGGARSRGRVTTVTPMKRGLKVRPAVCQNDTTHVTTVTPMKRGLKVHDGIRG